MIRRILSVLAGIIAGAMVVSGFEIIAAQLHPLPEGFDVNNAAAVAAHARTAPKAAMMIVLGGWAFAAFVAGLVSTLVSADRKRNYALICAAVFIAATIFNLYSIPSPLWFWILGLAVWIPGSLLGRKIITG